VLGWIGGQHAYAQVWELHPLAERSLEIQRRRATPQDAAALAAVEVRCWRAAYRGLMPDSFLDTLCQTEKTAAWRQNLLLRRSATCGSSRAGRPIRAMPQPPSRAGRSSREYTSGSQPGQRVRADA
jgi:hypothetical protein